MYENQPAVFIVSMLHSHSKFINCVHPVCAQLCDRRIAIVSFSDDSNLSRAYVDTLVRRSSHYLSWNARCGEYHIPDNTHVFCLLLSYRSISGSSRFFPRIIVTVVDDAASLTLCIKHRITFVTADLSEAMATVY